MSTIIPSNDLEAQLQKLTGPCLCETVKVLFRSTGMQLEDIVTIANVVNAQKWINKVEIALSPTTAESTAMYSLASLFAHMIHNHCNKKEISVDQSFLDMEKSPSLRLDQTATFLSSSASVITSLQISFSHEADHDWCDKVARAIASISSLRELELFKYGLTEFQFLVESTLYECSHQNKMRLNHLKIHGCGFRALSVFLPSKCASTLQKLDLGSPEISRMDAIGLKSGLMLNETVTDLSIWLMESEVRNAFEGLPLLFEYLEQESNLRRLELQGESHDVDGFFTICRQLSKPLQRKTNITELCLDLCSLGNDGGMGRDLLVGNRWLQSIDLVVPIEVLLDENFRLNLAEGLRHNRGLRSFELELDTEVEPDPESMCDLSVCIDAISNRDEPMEVLKFDFMCCKVSPPTWSSLTSLLQKAQSTLKEVDISFCYAQEENISCLIDAIANSPSLEGATLHFEDIQGAMDYNKICTQILKSKSQSLSNVSLSFSESVYDEWNMDEKARMAETLLENMNVNNKFLSVTFNPMCSRDSDLKRKMWSFCARNKAYKAALGLDSGYLRPTDLPDVLDDIERDCQMLHETTDVYFVNIWFALLHSRPLEIQKYCFP